MWVLSGEGLNCNTILQNLNQNRNMIRQQYGGWKFPFHTYLICTRLTRTHTARIFKVSLNKMSRRIWAREVNGHAKIYMWCDFQQFPASLFWKKWKKPPKMGFLANFSKLYGLFWPSWLLLTSQDIPEDLIYEQKGGRIALRLKKFGFKNWCFSAKLVIWAILGQNGIFLISTFLVF